MAGISLGTNISSQQAQRRLADTTTSLARVFERLSSGQRINRASDDAAGLAIADGLQAKSRVYTQGVRNLNDGISALNIAQGALQELMNVSIRQEELAAQAANGVYTLAQRKALNTEANALGDEFNRIVQSTSFNGVQLLDRSLGNLSLQAGFGTAESLSFAIGDSLARKVGTGSFNSTGTFNLGADTIVNTVNVGDVNGDGKLDLLVLDQYYSALYTFIGNGDGSFQAPHSAIPTGVYAFGGGASVDLNLGDFNNDGKLDLAVLDGVFLGNGDGTFRDKITMSSLGGFEQLQVGDFNNDGRLDIAKAEIFQDSVFLFLGNGDGTFVAPKSSALYLPANIEVADLNNDGRLDVVTTSGGGGTFVFAGNGDGTFRAATTILSASVGTQFGDLNGDGFLDVVASNSTVALGNGDFTFKAPRAQSGFSSSSVQLADIDNDGSLDIFSPTGVLLGNGDGTFKSRIPLVSGTTLSVRAGDLDGDGVLDLIENDYVGGPAGSNVLVFSARTTSKTTIARLNLLSQQSAREALTIVAAQRTRIANELGAIGSTQSRVAVAVNNLSTTNVNLLAAEGRIRDVDVASESSALVRMQILQQAAAGVLSQANQQPALALTLLGR